MKNVRYLDDMIKSILLGWHIFEKSIWETGLYWDWSHERKSQSTLCL